METINLGTGLGKGNGEYLRVAMQKVNANFTELNQNKQNKTLTDFDLVGTAPAISITAASDETVGYWTLSGNSTFALTMVSGRKLTLFVTKGAHTLTLPSNVKWINGTTPTLLSTGFNIIEITAGRGINYAVFVGNVLP